MVSLADLMKKANESVPSASDRHLADKLDGHIQETEQVKETEQKITPEALPALDYLKTKISELQGLLEKAAPGYEGLLFHIHKNLAENPDVNFLLSEEEVGTVVLGLSKKKGIVLAEAAKKSGNRTPSGKKLSDLTADDL